MPDQTSTSKRMGETINSGRTPSATLRVRPTRISSSYFLLILHVLKLGATVLGKGTLSQKLLGIVQEFVLLPRWCNGTDMFACETSNQVPDSFR